MHILLNTYARVFRYFIHSIWIQLVFSSIRLLYSNDHFISFDFINRNVTEVINTQTYGFNVLGRHLLRSNCAPSPFLRKK